MTYKSIVFVYAVLLVYVYDPFVSAAAHARLLYADDDMMSSR